MNANKVKQFLDKLVEGKTAEEQVVILRTCLEEHVFDHPWMDEEITDSILENIAREYELPFESDDVG